MKLSCIQLVVEPLMPHFLRKIEEERRQEFVHQISLEQLQQAQFLLGLVEVFSRKESGGLPPLPSHEPSITLPSGRYGDVEEWKMSAIANVVAFFNRK